MEIYNIHQIIYSINQIAPGDMNMENIVGQPPQPARPALGPHRMKERSGVQLSMERLVTGQSWA